MWSVYCFYWKVYLNIYYCIIWLDPVILSHDCCTVYKWSVSFSHGSHVNMAYYNAASGVNAYSATDLSEEGDIVDDLSIVPLDKDSYGEFWSFFKSNIVIC